MYRAQYQIPITHFVLCSLFTGVSEDVKKAAVAAKPESEIQVEDDGTIVATSSSTVTKHVQRFQLNKEFEEVEHFTQKKIKASLPSLMYWLCALSPFVCSKLVYIIMEKFKLSTEF